MRLSWLLVVTFIGSGCAPALDCTTMPDLSQLSHAEQLALKHSISAYSKECSSSQYQCAFRLTHGKKKELIVTTSFLYPDKDSGLCLQAIGGSKINVYDSNGRLQRLCFHCRPNNSFNPKPLRGSA